MTSCWVVMSFPVDANTGFLAHIDMQNELTACMNQGKVTLL